MDLADPKLTTFNEKEAIRVIGVALLCIQASPVLRPTMSRVVAMLAGDIEVSTVASKPGYLTDWDVRDITSSFLGDDTQTSIASTSTSYLTDTPVNLSEPILSVVRGEGR